ncbi:MAG: N-acetylmuramoyl-L-alanine amidase [Bacteroidales bacterium]|nr:N-acetylmuramoyl-L-alanine amidase [Bacteroidales bacterium]
MKNAPAISTKLLFLTLLITPGGLTDIIAQEKKSGNTMVEASLWEDYQKVEPFFEEAYRLHPDLPRGVLEAISFQYRRFSLLEPEYEDGDGHTIPQNHTVMGLTADGKGVFRESLSRVEELSSYPATEILRSPRIAVLAYAEAFATLQKRDSCYSNRIEDYKTILIELSELPYDPNPDSWSQNYPMNSSLYETYRFLSDTAMVAFTHHHWKVDFGRLFGEDWERLRQDRIQLPDFGKGTHANVDYNGATWFPAASCNYTSGRNGVAITGVTIHYTQGTYAGTLAWFQNCSANASAHYVIRSSDGQIAQMVREQDKAWHVGVANGYTIGVEHEAYGNIASFFTDTMYQASAKLVRNICLRRPSIDTRRTFYRDTLDDGTILNLGVHNLGGSNACTQIRGHQHYPSQTHTDPGPFWDWNRYYHLLNIQTPIVTDTSTTGSFYDSGGPGSSYQSTEHRYFLIRHTGADSIALNFTLFELEPNYDFLWLYGGDNTQAPRLGRWNTTSPGRIVSTGDALLAEFRSDCATNLSGWQATWECFPTSSTTPSTADTSAPVTHILHNDTTWITGNFTLAFEDTDDSGILYRLWQVMEQDTFGWQSNPHHGFLCDNFDNALDPDIWQHDSQWHIVNHKLTCTSQQGDKRRIWARHHDSSSPYFLYDFHLNMNTGDRCSFFFHMQYDSALKPKHGYEIRFDKMHHSASLYKIYGGVASLIDSGRPLYYSDNTSYLYRILWDREQNRILLFRHNSLVWDLAADTCGTDHSEVAIGFECETPITLDNLRVYAGREETTGISVGPSDTCILRTQAHLGEARCKVKSLVLDSTLHFSELAECLVKVDYTPPPVPLRIMGWKVYSNNSRVDGIPISFCWEDVVDQESGLADYQYTLYVISRLSTCQKDIWHTTTLTQTAPGTQVPWQSTSCKVIVKSRDHAGNISGCAISDDILQP